MHIPWKSLTAAASLLVLPIRAQWTDMTSGDLEKTGYDADDIMYTKEAVNLYWSRVAQENQHGLFWAGGATTEDDFYDIEEFKEMRLGDQAVMFSDVFKLDEDFQKKMHLDPSNKDHLWWRALNRISKALAAAATAEEAHVYLKYTGCRTLFSPPSQEPKDVDPVHGDVATNGEIFYYAELPMLMRNENIKRIITFSKEPGNHKFTTKVEWDVDRPGEKPRDFLPDIAMDVSPIILPPESKRPPLKRGLASEERVF